MSWKQDINKIIENTWSVGQTFTLNDIYQYVDKLAELYPDNSHIPDKIRQTLQYLRDEGIIKFIDNEGSYKRLL